jgi:hypothetical protein
MAKSKKGKEVSKQNAIKHGLYLHFADFFPCNLCLHKNKCSDFVKGGTCTIDNKSFNELMKKDLDELETLKQLINYNTVRLNRATEQLYNQPHHIELSRISAELRNLLQTYHIIKSRRECAKDGNQTKLLQHLRKESKLQLIQRV